MLDTTQKRISVSSSLGIIGVALDAGNRGRKLLISVSRTKNVLKGTLQGLHTTCLIACLCLESVFRGDINQVNPSVVCLKFLLVIFS